MWSSGEHGNTSGGGGGLEPHFQASLALLMKGLVTMMYHPLPSMFKLDTTFFLFQIWEGVWESICVSQRDNFLPLSVIMK